MGRFFRAIRGFFGRLLTGVEQRNPEILLENAVQDELDTRGQREAAIEVGQQKQEAQTSLAEIEGRIVEARKNSEEMERAFREQERRYNDVVRERAALMEEHQRSRALRAANEARSNVSLSDSSRDLESARQAIRQASYEAEA